MPENDLHSGIQKVLKMVNRTNNYYKTGDIISRKRVGESKWVAIISTNGEDY